MERYEEHTIAHAIQAQYEKTKVYLPVILFICYISSVFFFFVCAVVIYCLYINEITDKMEIPNVLTMPPHPPQNSAIIDVSLFNSEILDLPVAGTIEKWDGSWPNS